jgi:AraC-like DNA-binding protein
LQLKTIFNKNASTGNGTPFASLGLSSVSGTSFVRAAVRRLAQALDARDGAGVLSSGCLVTAAVRREPQSGPALRRATAILDAVLVAPGAPLPEPVRRWIERAADELATCDPSREHPGDVAARLDRLWRDVAATLAAPSAPGMAAAVQAFLAERLHERACLAELARTLGYSTSHVSGLIRRVTGERFSALRRRLQLERAQAALRRGLSAKQAAAEGGFSDPAYFSRVFRRTYGTTPARWRRAGLLA